MNPLEWLLVGCGAVCGFVIGLWVALGALHLQGRRNQARAAAEAVVKAGLLDELGRYKEMVQHLIVVTRIGEKRLELADREIELLKTGT